jgi:hypothetical protein
LRANISHEHFLFWKINISMSFSVSRPGFSNSAGAADSVAKYFLRFIEKPFLSIQTKVLRCNQRHSYTLPGDATGRPQLIPVRLQ